MTGRARTKKKGRRWYRQKMEMDNAVIAGDRRLKEVVYGYRFPSHPGRIKIGYSSRGLDRVAEQSTAFPEKPELVFLIHDPRARRIEEAFHMALSDRQSDVMGTEWFDVTWKDVLRVSPHLRHATGANRRDRNKKIIFTSLIAIAMLAIYPALSAAMVAISREVPMSVISLSIEGYLDRIVALDFSASWAMGREMLGYALSDRVSWILRILPAGLCALPLTMPWIRWRRQAC